MRGRNSEPADAVGIPGPFLWFYASIVRDEGIFNEERREFKTNHQQLSLLRQSPLKESEGGDACFVIFVKSTRFLY